MKEKDKAKKTHSITKYKSECRRTQNKVKHFIKHNIPSDADEATVKKLTNSFVELQSNRKRGK